MRRGASKAAVSWVASAAMVLLACRKNESQPESEPIPSAVAPEAGPTPAATSDHDVPEAPASVPHALIRWLGPDVRATAYAADAGRIMAPELASVFALPPRATRLLRALGVVDAALEALLPIGSGPAGDWLEPDALAIQTDPAGAPYVLRVCRRSTDALKTRLQAGPVDAIQAEGFTILEPRVPVPWKLILLDARVVAFVPSKVIGSGLDPLTAARDFPPSDVRRELERMFSERGSPALELMAAGPLLHFDLDQEVAQLQLHAEPWTDGGWDVRVLLTPVSDPTAALASLESRDTSLESDQVRGLADRVAYQLEGPGVLGRLQLTHQDLSIVYRTL